VLTRDKNQNHGQENDFKIKIKITALQMISNPNLF